MGSGIRMPRNIEARRALQMVGVLVAACLAEKLLVKAWIHSEQLVVYKTVGTRTFAHARHPWLAAHASLLTHVVELAGAAAAIYLSPAFVASSRRRAARWALATAVAGLVYLFAVSDTLAGGLYWYIARSNLLAIMHGQGSRFIWPLMRAAIVHFPQRTIPIAIGLAVV